MNHIRTSVTIGCLSLIVISFLMLTPHSDAKIDPKTIVGVWLFDEGGGDVAKDASGNRLDGKILGNIKWDKGKFGNALSFPGGEGPKNYIEVPEANSQNLAAFTVVMWLKVKSTGANQRLFSKVDKDDPGNKRNYNLEINFGAGDTGRIAFTNAAVCCKTADGPAPITDDKWHHVVGTYAKPFLRAYIDGKVGREENFPDPPDIVRGSIFIGARPDGTGTLNGTMDEVALFNKAMSEDEIKSIITDGLRMTTAVDPSGKLTTTWASIKTRD